MPSPTDCTSAHVKKDGGGAQGTVFSGGAWNKNSSSQQLEVDGDVNGVAQQLLLDTGASLSLTAPQFFEESNPELAEYIERNLRPTTQRLVGCNGEHTGCRGVVSLRMRVGIHEWVEPEVYVLDACPHPLIVSWPSLVREDFKLYSKLGYCQFGSGPLIQFLEKGSVQRQAERRTATAASALSEQGAARRSYGGAEEEQRLRGGQPRPQKRVRWRRELTDEMDWTPPQTSVEDESCIRNPEELRRAWVGDAKGRYVLERQDKRQRKLDVKAVKVQRVPVETVKTPEDSAATAKSNNVKECTRTAAKKSRRGAERRLEQRKRRKVKAGKARTVKPADTCSLCGYASLHSSKCPTVQEDQPLGVVARRALATVLELLTGVPEVEAVQAIDQAEQLGAQSAAVVNGSTAEASGSSECSQGKTVISAPLCEQGEVPSESRTCRETLQAEQLGVQCAAVVNGSTAEASDSSLLVHDEEVTVQTASKPRASLNTVTDGTRIDTTLDQVHSLQPDASNDTRVSAPEPTLKTHRTVFLNALGSEASAPPGLPVSAKADGDSDCTTVEKVDAKDGRGTKDTVHPTQVSNPVLKKRSRNRSQRLCPSKVEVKSQSGSQPGSFNSQRSARTNTRASRRASHHNEHPRVCPVKGVPLPTSGPVNVAELFVLPPMSEASIPVTLVHDLTNDKGAQYLFEPTPIPLMKGRMFRAAACVTQRRKNGEVLVRVMNPTCMEVTMHPGAQLGTWEHLSVKQVMSIQTLGEAGDNGDSPKRMASVKAEREGESREDEDEEEVTYATDEELEQKVAQGGGHLSKDERTRLTKLLQRYKYMFRKRPGRTDLVQHQIDTGDSRPIRGGRYRQSEKDRATIREIVKDMESMGVVRPSKSPWGASVVLVPKKDGTTRFCVDYRRLNEVTAKDVYPLPRIDATLDQLGGCKFFTAMDLTSGYWQVDMKDEDAAKTAFITPDGLFEFTAMPFGLCNAPATFQRLMDQVLGNLRYEYALVYLDDVMVHSKTFDEHLVHLEAVLSCLQQASLACKLKKCSFAQESTVYLGHVVSGKGIEPEPAKIAAVKEIEPPKNVKEIRMFLGFVGYYRRFINNFSSVAKPLNELLRKAVDWHWGTEQQDAFEALRDALITAPILQMPDFTKKFTVRTDASYNGLGACLLQGEGDERMPIAYASRSLKPAETRYTATEIECLGMKWAVGVFRPYIHGRRFTLETDHIALKWLHSVQHTNGRLIRTAMELQQYDMEIVHRAGIKMYDADALSRLKRMRVEATGEETAAMVASVTDQAVYYGEGDPTPLDAEYDEPTGPCPVTVDLLKAERNRAEWLEGPIPDKGPASAVYVALGQEGDDEGESREVLKEKIMEELQKDGYYSKLYQQLSKEDLPPDELTVRLRNDLSKFVVKEGHLYRIEQLYRGGRAQAGKVRYLLWIPEALRTDVLFACHDHLLSGGHLGVQKTFARLRQRYYWTGMFRSVENWCKSCDACSSRKDPVGIQAPLTPLPVPTEPFQMISVDVLGPFVAAEGSGNRYVLVYCDHLTRWVETIAFRRNDSAVMARVLVERIMCRHGAPQTLLSDRGRPFMSSLAKEVYRLLRVKKVSTAAYRPQTNGMPERFNRTLASMLSMYVNSKHNDWDVYLPYVTFAYNTTVHNGTKETPFFLLYGREARLPIDSMLLPTAPHEDQSVEDYRAELVEGLKVAHEFGRDALLRSKQQTERNRGNGTRVPEFAEGDMVMVKNPALNAAPGLTRKLTNAWVGPFKVLAKMGPTTYRVTGVTPQGRAVSINRLKKHYDYEHPESVEADYANHLGTAGQALPGEGNRTYAPTEREKSMQEGDGEHTGTTTGTVVDDLTDDTEESNTPESDPLPAPPVPRSRGRPKAPAPKRSTIVRRPENSPELGITPVAPDGGLRTICARCHQPKRNHKCKGRYIPARQLAVARRRLGLADLDARPVFGIVETSEDAEVQPKVYGVYAPNDVRLMNTIEGRLTSWEEEAKKQGRTEDDIWNEECFKCEKKGKVYTCYGCNLAYHARCSVAPVLSRRLRFEEDFLCPDCLRDCVDPKAPIVTMSMEEDTAGDGEDGTGVVSMVALVSSAPVVTVRPRWRSSWGTRFPGGKPHGWLASIKEDAPLARRHMTSRRRSINPVTDFPRPYGL